MHDPGSLIRQLADSRRALLLAAADLSNSDARRKPNSGEWSVVEVLAHIVDVDAHYLAEARAMVSRPGHAFEYFDDEAWKRAHPAPDEFELATVMSAVERSHALVLEAAAKLTDAELSIAGTHPRGISYTVRDAILRIAPHDDNHAAQIGQIRAALSFPTR